MSYKYGTITLTGTQFQQWTGITSTVATCQRLASGGIPAPGIITRTGPNGAVSKFNVSIVGEKYQLTQIYNAENGSVPAIQYEYALILLPLVGRG